MCNDRILVRWSGYERIGYDDQRQVGGIVGVGLRNDDYWGNEYMVEFKHIGGCPLPAHYLVEVLDRALQKLDAGWLERAESLHQTRKHPYKVRYHEGMSECKYYDLIYVREEEDISWGRYHKGGSIRVTASGRVADFKIWLGDLPPILEDMTKWSPFGDTIRQYYPNILKIFAPTPIDMDEFKEAGKPSGFTLSKDEEEQSEAL